MSDFADTHLLKLRPLETEAVNMFFQALSPLKEQLDAPDLAEIMINDVLNVWVEHRGVMSKVNVDLRPAHLEAAIHSLASSVDKSARAGSDKGIINAGHKNLRIAAVMNPTAIDGHALSIRKHRESKLSLSDYVAMGAFAAVNARPEIAEAIVFEEGIENEALMRALVALVQSRKNVLVAGALRRVKQLF